MLPGTESTPWLTSRIPFPKRVWPTCWWSRSGLYRAHARPLLLACALVFVPVSFAKSCAVSAMLRPTSRTYGHREWSSGWRAPSRSRGGRWRTPRAPRATATRSPVFGASEKRLEEVGGEASIAGGTYRGGTLWVLGVLAALVSALAFAVAIYVTGGAVTMAVADRLTGGDAGWVESWMLLVRRPAAARGGRSRRPA